MKKLIILVTVIAISFVSCSENDESLITINEANIMKKWYYKEYVVSGQTFPYQNESCGRDYIEFMENDIYKEYYVYSCDPTESETDTGTWALSGTTLTVNILGENHTGVISSLTGATMQISTQGDWDENGTIETIKLNLTSN